ncbi:MAG: hypothetical protein AAGK04_11810 [Planctomycetota bacterium]
MSAKWRRSLAWDDRAFPAWAWPLKALLRAFSSIKLSVSLLSIVALFGLLASVPIGLLALIPTYLIYGLALLLVIAIPVTLALWLGRRLLVGWGPVPRRLALGAAGVSIALAAAWLWFSIDTPITWPSLRYDTVHQTGVRLVPEFVAAYDDTTLRRLPGFEMTELEFYSWWPLRVVLAAFVLNMVVATLRRIEFTFKNIGVLTVHTGIVVISIGSIYYAGLKREGDLFLQAGLPDATTGAPGVGPAIGHFYDINAVALHVATDGRFEQWPMRLPRYNAYALDAGPDTPTAWSLAGRPLPADAAARGLDRPILRPNGSLLDERVSFRVVGYAPYAEPRADHERIDPSTPGAVDPAVGLQPLRLLQLLQYAPGASPSDDDTPAFAFWFLPRDPVRRLAENAAFAIEVQERFDPLRWAALQQPIPERALQGLVVEVPEVDGLAIIPAEPGATIGVGDYDVEVREMLPEPPFPIVTDGYRGGTSSVAIVRVSGPGGEVFDRYVYHRYPEINQDLVQGAPGADGRPQRRDPDPAIRVWFLDDTKIQIYLQDAADGAEAIVRAPGRAPRRMPLEDDRLADFIDDPTPSAPRLDLRVAQRWRHSRPFERPIPTPESEQDRERIGTHRDSLTAIEVSMPFADAPGGTWHQLVWIPFNPFAGDIPAGQDMPQGARRVRLPDGRRLTLAVGPVRHRFGDFRVALADFEMLAYDHRGAPRDYQSTLRVTPRRGIAPDGSLAPAAFEPYTHVTKLNSPLRAPFMESDDRPPLVNLFGRLASGFSPNQFKLSQSGWDQQGWQESQAQADRGEISRPFARFTILRVGNNPGIYVVALGSVLVALGTPWAFYVKPWLVRRERDRLRREHQSEPKPVASPTAEQKPARALETAGGVG